MKELKSIPERVGRNYSDDEGKPLNLTFRERLSFINHVDK